MGNLTPTQQKRRVAAAAIQLRLSGASYTDVAHTLGLEKAGSARAMVEKELALRTDEDPQGREILRGEESARLLALLSSVWDKATDVEHPEHLQAQKVALAIIDRHIRLRGLDEPTEVVLHTPTATELEQWVQSVVSQAAPGVIEADVVAEIEA